jgi:hypothetical protein
MEPGPLEIVLIKFPGNHFKGEIAPALKDLIARDVIRIIDVLFMEKDAGGTVSIKEINDLDDPVYEVFDPVIEDVTGLLSREDVDEVSQSLEANSSAALMLFEHTWAIHLRDTIDRSHGEVVMSERVPREAVAAAIAASENSI